MQRPTFRSSIALDFFSVKALQLQIGHPLSVWPLALLKELIDNALDSCERQGVPPEIAITVMADTLSVRDNGGGLSEALLRDSLDYTIRVSDKTFFVSPTRGQLGNGLKTVWAEPAVAAGDAGAVEVITADLHDTIRVRLDRLTQTPHVERTPLPAAAPIVKSGTLLRIHWPRIAGGAQRAFLQRPQRCRAPAAIQALQPARLLSHRDRGRAARLPGKSAQLEEVDPE